MQVNYVLSIALKYRSLQMKKEKTTIQENTIESSVLPEFINGIPTSKHRSKERMELIRSYYQRLWKRLQREKGVYTVFNDYQGQTDHRNTFGQ